MPSLTIFGSKLVQRYLGLGANGKSGRRDDEVVEQYLLAVEKVARRQNDNVGQYLPAGCRDLQRASS